MSVYEDYYPPEDGPFKIGDHLIRETMDRTDPPMVVTLDWGAFRRVWELVEEAGKTHYPAHDTLSTARAELRAVTAFRDCWRSAYGSRVPEAQPAEKKAGKDAEPPQKRQFRRKAEETPPAPTKRQFKRRG